MKNKVVNTDTDMNEILSSMLSTFKYKENWIKSTNPSITEIIDKFPKFIQMPFLLSIIQITFSKIQFFINFIIYQISEDFKISFNGVADNLIINWELNFAKK